MSGHKPKQNMSASSKGAVATTTTTSSDTIRPRQLMAQNFLLIWMDAGIDRTNKECQNTLAQLRSAVNDVNIITEPDECVDFLTEIDDIKVFLIVAGTIGQQIVPLIHDISQLDEIYIFCASKPGHEQWTKEWAKIKGVYTEITPVCEALQMAVKQCNQDSIAISFVKASEGAPGQNLDQLEPSFMYTQIFKEILLEMEHGKQSIKDLAVYCRKLYVDNGKEVKVIDEFQRDYQVKSSIWWYTRECFTYQMFNRALRTLEADTIINMGFFIRDLHHEIKQLHQQQVGSYHEKTFTVYRGQVLSKTDFEKLLKTKGRLMSFNSFLSTSKSRDVSLRFAKSASGKTDTVGILFQMFIDPSISSIPFASIRDVSYFKTEEEVLFFMYTVFREGEIIKMDNNSSIYQVELKLTADDDQQLRILTKRIREETSGSTGWQRLGTVLIKLSQFDKAEELYKVLLEQTSNEGEKAFYYNQLGYIKHDQSDYEKAIWYYERLLEIKEKTLPANDPSLATPYNNIACVHRNMGEYSKALSFYQKALEIFEKTLPSNHPDLATFYNNIGSVYLNMGEYSKALSFNEKDLEILQKTLAPNHPALATSYNNIAAVYYSTKNYSKSVSFYERALNIFQSSLSANHPNIKLYKRTSISLKRNYKIMFDE